MPPARTGIGVHQAKLTLERETVAEPSLGKRFREAYYPYTTQFLCKEGTMFSRLIPGRYSQAPIVAETRSPGWLKRLITGLLGKKGG